MFLIVASSVVLCFEDIYLHEKPELQAALNYLNIVFAVLFLVEMILKIFALGIKKYFTSFWTILDFVIVGVCLPDVLIIIQYYAGHLHDDYFVLGIIGGYSGSFCVSSRYLCTACISYTPSSATITGGVTLAEHDGSIITFIITSYYAHYLLCIFSYELGKYSLVTLISDHCERSDICNAVDSQRTTGVYCILAHICHHGSANISWTVLWVPNWRGDSKCIVWGVFFSLLFL